MGNGYHDDGGGDAEQPDAYWRRRVITLALGLGLLGVLAWAFSGGGAKPTANTSPAGVLQATALSTAVPGLASGSPSASGTPSPNASGSPGASMSASPGASASASRSAAASGKPQPSVTPGATAPAAGGRCAPGSLVLSLFSDRSSYGPSQYPQFVVYAVSTTGTGCVFDPAQLQVQVMASGRIVWDSTDCVHTVPRPVELARGVPAQSALTWDRTLTLPGCQLLATAARSGSYTAQARTATVQSPIRTFRLTS